MKYSINFMWINRKLSFNQKYIVPNIDNLITIENNWKDHGIINFWYDSEMVTKEQINNTRNETNLNLLDIRQIKKVQKNAIIFSDKTPVYFRADLLRVMSGLHLLKKDDQDYYVYLDMDVSHITREELFDKETRKNLDKYGIVLAKSKITIFENGFQIIANNDKIKTALKHSIINLNIARAHNALSGNFHNIGTFDSPIKSLSEVVFYSYNAMFHYLNYLLGTGILYKVMSWNELKKYGFDNVKDDEEYIYEKHGLKPFNLYKYCKYTNTGSLYFSNKCDYLEFPTKYVIMPRPQGCYDSYLPDSELYFPFRIYYGALNIYNKIINYLVSTVCNPKDPNT